MKTDPDLKVFLRDSSYNLGRQILAILIGLVTSALMARGLGTQLQGLYSLTLLLPLTLISFTNLGISSSTVYYAAHEDYDAATTLHGTLYMTLILGLISLAGGWLVGVFFRESLFPGATTQFLSIAALITPLLLLKMNLSAILQGFQDFKRYNLAEIIAQVSMLAFVILFIWVFPLGVVGALLAFLLSNLSATLVMAYFLLKNTGVRALLRMRPNLHFVRDSLSYGMRSYLSDMIAFLNLRADKYLLNIFAGAPALGIYDVAVQIGEKLWIVSRAIGTVLFPRIASMEQDETNRVRLTLFMVRNVFWASALTALVVLPFLNLGIRLLYGNSFIEAAPGVALLLPGIVSLSASRLLSFDMSGRGKPQINAYAAFFSFVINVLCNVILIPKMGLRGAAISSSISYTSTFILRSILFCRETGASWQSIILPNQHDLAVWQRLIRSLTQKANLPSR